MKHLQERLPVNLRGAFSISCFDVERSLDKGIKKEDAIKAAFMKQVDFNKLNILKTPGMSDYLEKLKEYANQYISERLYSEPTGEVKDKELTSRQVRSLGFIPDTGNSNNYAVPKGYFPLEDLEEGSIGIHPSMYDSIADIF